MHIDIALYFGTASWQWLASQASHQAIVIRFSLQLYSGILCKPLTTPITLPHTSLRFRRIDRFTLQSLMIRVKYIQISHLPQTLANPAEKESGLSTPHALATATGVAMATGDGTIVQISSGAGGGSIELTITRPIFRPGAVTGPSLICPAVVK